jgi:peptidoglycan/xylan/chitin deacetylase (PgdA/CDA1 family)
MYHSIHDARNDPYGITVPPAQFEAQLTWLKARGLIGVRLDVLLEEWSRGRGNNLVGLTFDDGYVDFVEVAVPILRDFNFTATVFSLAGQLGAYNDWDPGAQKPLMSAAQLQRCTQLGMEVGSHGYRHLSMVDLDDERLLEATVKSREVLCSIVGAEIRNFAYPYGRFGPREMSAVSSAGYYSACASSPSGRSLYALPRTYVGSSDNLLRLYAKLLRYHLMYRSPAGGKMLGQHLHIRP